MAEPTPLFTDDDAAELRRRIAERTARDGELGNLRNQVTETDNPDDAAYDLEKSRELGIPRVAIGGARDQYRDEDALAKMQRLAKEAPSTSRWLQDSDNYAVSRDDIDSLTTLERVTEALRKTPQAVGTFGPAMDAAIAGVALSSLESPGLSPVDAAITQNLDKVRGLDEVGAFGRKAAGAVKVPEINTGGFRNPFKRGIRKEVRDAVSGAAMKTAGALETSRATAIEGATARAVQADERLKAQMPRSDDPTVQGYLSGVSSLVQMAPAMGAGIASKRADVTLGIMGRQVYGQSYADVTADTELGLDAGGKALYSGGQSGIERVTEMLPAHILFGKNQVGKNFLKRFMTSTLAEVGTEQAATLGQNFVDWQVKNPDKTADQFVAEMGPAAYETLIATIVASGAMNTIVLGTEKAMVDMGERQRLAEMTPGEQGLDKAFDAAGKAKLRTRSPARFEAFVEGLGVEDVTLDLDGVTDALEQAGIDPAEALTGLGLTEDQLAQAFDIGGEISIKTARLLASPLATEQRQILQPHIRVATETYTPAQKEAERAKFNGEAQSMIEELQASLQGDLALADSEQYVLDAVTQRMESAALYDDATATQTNAVAHAAQVIVLAKRIGEDPKAFYDQYGPRIQGSVDGMVSEGELEQNAERKITYETYSNPALEPAENKAVEMLFNGWTRPEIEDELQVSPEHLRVLLSKARKKGVEIGKETGGRSGSIRAYAVELKTKGVKDDAIAERIRTRFGTSTTKASVSSMLSQERVKIRNEGGTPLFQDGEALPMDEPARMARARAMGFDTDLLLYHGSPAIPNAFVRGDGVHGFGVYFTTNSKRAAKYGPNVGSYYVRGNLATPEMYVKWTKETNDGWGAARIAKENGYTGIRIDDNEVLVFDAANIRRIGAEFDPSKGDSRTLLAQEQSGPKGTFDPKNNIIRLTEARNLSTFMHESAHWYFDVLEKMAAEPNAHPFIQEQLDAVETWYQDHRNSPQMARIRSQYSVVETAGGFQITFNGVNTDPIQPSAEAAAARIEWRERHEAFAETFEDFLRTGKAPTAALRDVFRTFKEWITRVYKNALSPLQRANLTPEITAVFDRMLATDEEISGATREFETTAEKMAQDMLDKGIITEREFEKAKAKLIAAREQVKEEFMGRLMDDYARTTTAQADQERKRIRGQVTREIDRSPAGRALAWLGLGEWKGDISDARHAENESVFYQGTDRGEAIEWRNAVAKGLDMSLEARMARAKADGFDTDTVLYHGTDKDFKAFDQNAGTGARSGTGTWLTTSRENANSYAPRLHQKRGVGGQVYPVHIKKGNYVEVDASGANWSNLSDKVSISLPSIKKSAQSDLDLLAALGEDVQGLSATQTTAAKRSTLGDVFGRMTFDESNFSTNDIAAWARKQGYDGVKFKNVKDRGGVGDAPEGIISDSIVIFDPKNIRSTNAAFDPDASDSSNLLAQDAPRSLGAMTRMTDEQIGEWYVDNIREVRQDIGDNYRVVNLHFKTDDSLAREDAVVNFKIDGKKVNADLYLNSKTTADVNIKELTDAERKERQRNAANMFARAVAAIKHWVALEQPGAVVFSGSSTDHEKLYNFMLSTLAFEGYTAHRVNTIIGRITTEDNVTEGEAILPPMQQFVVLKDGENLGDYSETESVKGRSGTTDAGKWQGYHAVHTEEIGPVRSADGRYERRGLRAGPAGARRDGTGNEGLLNQGDPLPLSTPQGRQEFLDIDAVSEPIPGEIEGSVRYGFKIDGIVEPLLVEVVIDEEYNAQHIQVGAPIWDGSALKDIPVEQALRQLAGRLHAVIERHILNGPVFFAAKSADDVAFAKEILNHAKSQSQADLIVARNEGRIYLAPRTGQTIEDGRIPGEYVWDGKKATGRKSQAARQRLYERAKTHDGARARAERRAAGNVQDQGDGRTVRGPVDGLLYQGEPAPEKNLFLAHNTSAEKLRKSLDLGGLPMPSLAVARTDKGGFPGFGEITLLADPALLNERDVTAYDTDIYSPVVPEALPKVDEAKAAAFVKKALPHIPDGSKVTPYLNIDETERDLPNSLMRSKIVQVSYLGESGRVPKLKKMKVPPEVRKAKGMAWGSEELDSLAAAYYRRLQDETNAARAEHGRELGNIFFDDDGFLNSYHMQAFNRMISDLAYSPYNLKKFEAELYERTMGSKAARNKFEKYASDLANEITESRRIFKGFTYSGNRKFVPFNLENVMAEMRKDLREGNHDAMGGTGSIRARAASAPMQTMRDVQNNRDRIVSEEDMRAIKDSMTDRFTQMADAIHQFFKFSATGFRYLDATAEVLAGGKRDWLESFDSGAIPIIEEYIAELKALPTEYFEAKANRVMQPQDFAVAIVPRNLPTDMRQALTDAGVRLKFYKSGDEADRLRVISNENSVLFQGGQGSNPGGWGPTSPPPDMPPMRLDLREVREAYGEDAVKRLPTEIKRRSLIGSAAEDLAGIAKETARTLKEKPPKTLAEFVRSRGTKKYASISKPGIKGPNGIKGAADELKRMGREDLINESSGRDIDYVREMAEEAGYIRATSSDGRTTVQDLLDALDLESRGESVYSEYDAEDVSRMQAALQWGTYFGERNIDIYEKDQKKLTKAISQLVEEGDDLVTPDEAAPFFGYETGEELIAALTMLGNRNKRIREETERRFSEEFGDTFNDGTLREEARIAAHGSMQMMATEMELEALARAVGEQASSRAAKQMAQEALSIMTVAELRKYRRYLQDERRHGRNAVDAVRKGDFIEAMKHKRRQMVTMHMFREAEKLNEKIEKTRKHLLTYQTQKGRRERIANDYLEKIDEIMEAYEMRVSKMGLGQQKKARAVAEWVQSMKDQEREEEIAPEALLLAAAAEKQSWLNLTSDETDYLRSTIDNIAHLGRTKNSLISARDKRRFDAVIASLVDRMNETGKLTGVTRERSPTRTVSETLVDAGREAHSWLMRPEHQARSLDDGEQGPVWNALFRPMAEASDVETRMMRESTQLYRDAWSKFSASQRRQMVKTSVAVPELPSVGKRFTRLDLISIALNWGVQYNRDVLLEGYGWTEAQVEAALFRTLDDSHWDFIESLWQIAGMHKDEAFALEKAMTGVEPKAVEGVNFTLPNGRVIEGKYYHIAYDGNQPGEASRRQAKDTDAEALSQHRKSRSKAMTKNGGLIERKGSGGRPVKLGLSVFERALAETIHDIAFRRAVFDAGRIVSEPSFADTFQQVAGMENYRQLVVWLKDIANPPSESLDPIVKAFAHVRRNVPLAVMGMKVGTALIQPSGILAAMPIVGHRRMALAVAQAFTNRDKSLFGAWKAVAEKSEFMRDRIAGYERDVRETTTALTKGGATDYLRRNAFVFINGMDVAVSTPIWMAAYGKAMDGKVKGIASGQEEDAIAYADSVIRRTQTAGKTQDLSRFQRGGEFQKQISMIFSYFNNLYALSSQQTLAMRRGQMTRSAWAYQMTILFVAIPLMAEAMAGRLFPGDDDDDESLAGNMGQAVISNFVGMFPGIRDLVAVNLKPEFGYRMSPTAKFAEDIGKTVGLPLQLLLDEDKELTEYDIKRAVNAAGGLTGIPSAQINITGEYIIDLLQGNEDPAADPLDAASEAFVRNTR